MEQYTGIKFDVIFIQGLVPEFSVCDELTKWGSILADKGCIPTYPNPDDPHKISSAGNLSMRVGNSFLITAAGSNLGQLSSDDFVEILDVDIERKLIRAIGIKDPSSETMLHGSIYQKREDVHVIFHGHNQEILKQCGALGLKSTRQWFPYGTRELVESVCAEMGENEQFLIMKDHGFLSFGKTCQQAGNLVIKVLQKIQNFAGV